jgi:hypothetical protein
LENGLEQTTKVLNENMYATQKKKKLNLINLKSLEDYRLKIYLKVKNFMVSNNTYKPNSYPRKSPHHHELLLRGE